MFGERMFGQGGNVCSGNVCSGNKCTQRDTVRHLNRDGGDTWPTGVDAGVESVRGECVAPIGVCVCVFVGCVRSGVCVFW